MHRFLEILIVIAVAVLMRAYSWLQLALWSRDGDGADTADGFATADADALEPARAMAGSGRPYTAERSSR